MKACTIRTGQPEDAPFTLEIAREALSEGYGIKNLQEFHGSLEKEKAWITRYEPPAFFLVAEVQGEVVGFLNFDVSLFSATRHQGTFGLNIKRRYRNIGIGRQIVGTMIDRCRHSQIDIIRLNVMESNEPAIHLYESLGFQREGVFQDYIRRDGRSESLIHMALHIRS